MKAREKSVIPVLAEMVAMSVVGLVTSMYGATAGVFLWTAAVGDAPIAAAPDADEPVPAAPDAAALPSVAPDVDELAPAAADADVRAVADGLGATAVVVVAMGLASAASLALQPAASISAAAVRQANERRFGFMPEILAFIPVIDA
ncbi:hypothetical protein [Paractinoplanes atraurantiacus]|uniref:hypothetical protein n=1 Tax=Paractinoplanes atraurantiacus TaxID=1036182 RepID=UPI0011774E70|nr:hypothetical protein [Actinoplanes atraurantiacus]